MLPASCCERSVLPLLLTVRCCRSGCRQVRRWGEAAAGCDHGWQGAELKAGWRLRLLLEMVVGVRLLLLLLLLLATGLPATVFPGGNGAGSSNTLCSLLLLPLRCLLQWLLRGGVPAGQQVAAAIVPIAMIVITAVPASWGGAVPAAAIAGRRKAAAVAAAGQEAAAQLRRPKQSRGIKVLSAGRCRMVLLLLLPAAQPASAGCKGGHAARVLARRQRRCLQLAGTPQLLSPHSQRNILLWWHGRCPHLLLCRWLPLPLCQREIHCLFLSLQQLLLPRQAILRREQGSSALLLPLLPLALSTSERLCRCRHHRRLLGGRQGHGHASWLLATPLLQPGSERKL